jgi:hypothetical protein
MRNLAYSLSSNMAFSIRDGGRHFHITPLVAGETPPLALSLSIRFNSGEGASHMTSRRQFRRPFLLAAALAFFAAFIASPARADRCDDTAKQLAEAIDGLKVNFKAANIIYLTHPAATELSLGCQGSQYATELYAKGDRKLKPDFLNLVGSAAAVIFTLPKDDTMTGTSRCLKRLGILRGNKIVLRYKRLDMECDRTKTDASIVVRRGLDQ